MEERENVDYSTLFDEGNAAESEESPAETVAEEAEEVRGKREVQPPAERAKYAAARRRAERERDEMLARERESHARQIDALIADMGLTDPETGKPIETREAYEAYRAAPKRGAEAVEQSAEDAEQKAQQTDEIRRQLERGMQIRAEIERDLAEISRLDGAPQTLESLRASEAWPGIDDRLRRGYSLLDAYQLANMDRLGERRSAAARQRAINAMTQKQHMLRTEQRGMGAPPVPADIKAAYLALNPAASEGEIARHYARYRKK